MHQTAVKIVVMSAIMAIAVAALSAQEEDSWQYIDAEAMAELYEKNESFVLLDVQTREENMDFGAPPECLCIPLRLQDPVTREWRDNPEFLTDVQAAIAKEARLIILCTMGKRSVKAAELLAANGFLNIFVFENGIHGKETEDGRLLPGWIQSSLPFEPGIFN